MPYFYSSTGKQNLGALALAAMAVAGDALAAETGLRTSTGLGFTGFSVYTATGYQNATINTSNLRAQSIGVPGIDSNLPSQSDSMDSTFWLVGLDYTHVFANQFSLGAQFDYYPKSGQYALSVSPGYEFNDRVLGYVRLGWANVPTTINQGVGQPSYKTWLNAYFVGVGTKVNIYRGIYGYAELRYSTLERLNFTRTENYSVAPGITVPVRIEGSADTTAINAFIGLGYRF